MPETMWAAEYDRYGGPDVLEVRRVPRPASGEDEVLVRVAGIGVSRIDVI